jgi:hypothetical protein
VIKPGPSFSKIDSAFGLAVFAVIWRRSIKRGRDAKQSDCGDLCAADPAS